MPATVQELMATFLARDMADGEEIFVGTNLPVIRAGALLAHLHHGPNMRVMVAHTRTNLYRTPVIEHFELLTDWRAGRWAEALLQRQRDRRVPEEPPRLGVLRRRAADRPATATRT